MSELFVIVAMVIGIAIGRWWDVKAKPKERKGNRARERPEHSNRETERAVAVRNREFQNMLNYNGDAQQKIDPNTILERR